MNQKEKERLLEPLKQKASGVSNMMASLRKQRAEKKSADEAPVEAQPAPSDR